MGAAGAAGFVVVVAVVVVVAAAAVAAVGVDVADVAAESNWHTFGQGLGLGANACIERHFEKEEPLLRCFLRSASVA